MAQNIPHHIDSERPSTLHLLLERRVDQSPDAVAVSGELGALTYRDLDRRANQLARALRARGVGRETLVGLCVERGLDLVVGILGILKAGGAYVPLDPATPRERIRFILKDTAVPVLVSQRHLLEDLGPCDLEVLLLDSDRESIASQPDTRLATTSSPEDLAYVIFTSGSTGTPKGVLVEHGMVTRLFSSTHPWFEFDERDVWTLFHSCAFDFSVWELWGALLHGGRLVVVPYGVSRSPGEFHELLRRERVTVLNQTPSAFRQLARADAAGPEADELSLRLVIFGGEALDLQSLKPWFERHGDRRPQLVNMYGITETTVHVTYRRILASDACGKDGSLIGQPIPDLQLHILDGQGEPVAPGIAGEVYVGGAGVARGYLGRPELTVERFVSDPFAERPGARMYRTGDVARFLPNGDIEYVGRNDQQVQVRGFRVELGEIRAALIDQDGVSDAVVVASADHGADVRLVAYVVPDSDEQPTVAGLRAALGGRLPDYMVPSAVVKLDAFPLTPNGKLDREALPAPERQVDGERVAPRDAVEAELVRIWERFLGVGDIGVLDSFIELGGDSVRGARIASELQERLGETVYVSAVFEAPSVESLAIYLRENYEGAEAKLCGEATAGDTVPTERAASEPEARIGELEIAQLQSVIEPLGARPGPAPRTGEKNPQAVFVLSPPRSGSTLFRIMLGGHTELFAPPELELMSFNSMGERRAKCVGRYEFILEGAIRTILELEQCSPEEARQIVADYEEQDLPVREFYRRIQERCGARILVEKTTIYGHDPRTLERIEEDFDAPLYIQLARHPCGMIRSAQEARFDRVFRWNTSWSPRQLGELLWTINLRNISAFLDGIPEERKHCVGFEALVREPGPVLEGVCRFLGVEFQEDMLDPYRNQERRMTDGLHRESRIIGDFKFAQHKRLDAGVADTWKGVIRPESLGDPARRLARALGFDDVPPPEAPTSNSSSPVSFAQQRLWSLDQIGTGAAHNLLYAYRISGELDPAALERALRRLVRRHETLRTRFQVVAGQPVQRISDDVGIELHRIDLGALPEEDREGEIERLLRIESDSGFDLARGPLLRVGLAHLADHEHVLIVGMHPIVSDDWSMDVLFRDLGALYAACREDCEPDLPELTIQYSDFAIWQRGRMQSEALEDQLAYWRAQLAGLEVLNLPTDRPRPATRTFSGAAHRFELDPELSQAILGLSGQQGLAPSMTVLGPFLALLQRYTGQDDIAVGFPVAGRTRPELEHRIGLLGNALVLRTDLSGDPTFEELLGRVRDVALSAYQNQELPFERLVDELEPERDLGRTPLFQIAFVYDAPRARLELSDLDVTALPVKATQTGCDMEFCVAELSESFVCDIVYNEDLFEGPTIARLGSHFRTLLESALSSPDARLSELALLKEEERRMLLEDWNRTDAEYPDDACFHELFEARAQEAPDALAIVFEEQRLTYAELDARANQLAHALRDMGVGPDVLVGLCVERSPEMLVGLLGILKAGGAYVPLDPSYPLERLAFLFDDCGASVMLTQERLLSTLPAFEGRVLCLDRDWGEVSAWPQEAPPSIATPDNLAYAIYTSGSTGTPKGTLLPHRGLCNLAAVLARELELTREDRVLQFSSLSFDVSALEVAAALPNGAAIYLGSLDTLRPGPELLSFLEENEISIAMVPPTTLAALPLAELPALRTLAVGGEVCSAEMIARWAPGRSFFNMYGPTEATIQATMAPLEADGRPPHIGRPIGNVRIYVLDEHLQPVPVGVAGELHIAGVGLARGYLNRTELTAERFIQSPFREDDRLYRTGDLVRYRQDGNVEFLGRIDHQVKFHGFRIELGEIDAALARLDAVRDALTLCREDTPGEKSLVAYVVLAGEARPSPAELRTELGSFLPNYMLPAAFVYLEELPLNANGKVDRRALPAPGRQVAGERVAPRDAVEAELVDIWERLLGVGEIGVLDAFIDLGGDSLRGARIASELQERLGETVYVSAVFEASSIEMLAIYLRENYEGAEAKLCGETTAGDAVPTVRAASEPKARIGEDDVSLPEAAPTGYPLSTVQQRLWFLDRAGAGAAYNVAKCWRINGGLDLSFLERSINAIVARHEALRTRVSEGPDALRQIVEREQVVPLRLVDLSDLPQGQREEAARGAVNEEAGRPFDLARGPLLRCTLIRIAEGVQVLALVVHHIVFDNESVGVFSRELEANYRALAGQGKAQLPPVASQYGQFAETWRAALTEELLAQQLSYWKGRLGGELPVLDLPTDRPRPTKLSFEGGAVDFAVTPELELQLKALGRRRGVTPAMLFQAAFACLLGRYAGQDDVVMGLGVTMRGQAATREMIGFFVNTVVMRTDLSDDPSFEDLLARVRQETLGAIDNQGLPFERLVEELAPERDPSRNPLFQVVFAFRDGSREELCLPGVEIAGEPVDQLATHFDLELHIAQNPDGFAGRLVYSSRLFDRTTMERMVEHFLFLLEGLVQQPQAPLSELPTLSPGERERVLHTWNDTRTPYPSERCVHELFAEQVRRAPDATAVVYGERRLSYGELDARAEHLAWRLRELGVESGTPVGLLAQRGPELIAGMVAILKAGGAYVPLDPAYPAQRLAYLLEDTDAPVLLIQGEPAGELATYGGQILRLDKFVAFEDEPPPAPQATTAPDRTAYVIYTSGSTGEPKGVCVPHRAIVRLVRDSDYVQLGPGDRVAQASTTSFDAATFEVWGALLNGAALVGISKEEALHPEAMAAAIRERRISTLFITTALFNQLVAHDPAIFAPLRDLLFGGEAVDPARVREVLRGGPPKRLLHVYGPTENTTFSTWHEVREVPEDARTVPIGRPIANSTAYVLDGALRPVPIGVCGELYLGGDGLASGYLNAPELTESRFVPDPFAGGARLYRTGDRVRIGADGAIEFVGRLDTQLKIRGHRIEPGEVEASLLRTPGVNEAIVIGREDTPGDKRLVAYVAASAPQPTPKELRALLKQGLPDFMVPTAIVILDALPLNANGKVDRRALPVPEVEAVGDSYCEPIGETEEILSAIWEELLHVDRVSRDASFFDFGGHSLLAMQVVNRVRASLGVEISLQDFFEDPTVAGLAKHILVAHSLKAQVRKDDGERREEVEL